MKLLVQHGDLLDGGFLSRNTGHLKFQLSNILTRPGGNDGLRELEIILPGKYVGNDIWSIEGAPLGSAVATDTKVDANDANVFASERLTTEGAGGRKTRGSLGNDLFTAT